MAGLMRRCTCMTAAAIISHCLLQIAISPTSAQEAGSTVQACICTTSLSSMHTPAADEASAGWCAPQGAQRGKCPGPASWMTCPADSTFVSMRWIVALPGGWGEQVRCLPLTAMQHLSALDPPTWLTTCAQSAALASQQTKAMQWISTLGRPGVGSPPSWASAGSDLHSIAPCSILCC